MGMCASPTFRISDNIFMCLVRCATHQAGLPAKSGIIGTIASVFGSMLHETITGVIVRLFKYVINDYYDEFLLSGLHLGFCCSAGGGARRRGPSWATSGDREN